MRTHSRQGLSPGITSGPKNPLQPSSRTGKNGTRLRTAISFHSLNKCCPPKSQVATISFGPPIPSHESASAAVMVSISGWVLTGPVRNWGISAQIISIKGSPSSAFTRARDIRFSPRIKTEVEALRRGKSPKSQWSISVSPSSSVLGAVANMKRCSMRRCTSISARLFGTSGWAEQIKLTMSADVGNVRLLGFPPKAGTEQEMLGPLEP